MPTKYLGCREMSQTKNQLSKKLTAAESNANRDPLAGLDYVIT